MPDETAGPTPAAAEPDGYMVAIGHGDVVVPLAFRGSKTDAVAEWTSRRRKYPSAVLLEEIAVLRVRCGLTVVEVREPSDRGWWHAFDANSEPQPIRHDYAAAVEDARRLAVAEERRRLLTLAMDEALEADAEGGESRG